LPIPELEIAVADQASQGATASAGHALEPGTPCANCDTPLQGAFCHACGQAAQGHKRSVLHMTIEVVEDMFHLDGRLMRTLPDLFLRPGRLAGDYIAGRLARHVPPFRMFLVALLLFIFAAEHATHELQLENARDHAAQVRRLATPQGRAAEAAKIRAEAKTDLDKELKEAADDRAGELKDPSEDKARIEQSYQAAVARERKVYDREMARADRVASGQASAKAVVDLALNGEALEAGGDKGETKVKAEWFRDGLRKAIANPEYYLTVMFGWGHRLAVLLLPIVGLSLALVYSRRRQFYIADHMLVAMNILSFSFLTNAVGLILPFSVMGWWMLAVALWTPVNLFQTLRGAYGSGVVGAALKTLLVWTITVVSFLVLLLVLMAFTLTQI